MGALAESSNNNFQVIRLLDGAQNGRQGVLTAQLSVSHTFTSFVLISRQERISTYGFSLSGSLAVL